MPKYPPGKMRPRVHGAQCRTRGLTHRHTRTPHSAAGTRAYASTTDGHADPHGLTLSHTLTHLHLLTDMDPVPSHAHPDTHVENGPQPPPVDPCFCTLLHTSLTDMNRTLGHAHTGTHAEMGQLGTQTTSQHTHGHTRVHQHRTSRSATPAHTGTPQACTPAHPPTHTRAPTSRRTQAPTRACDRRTDTPRGLVLLHTC